MCTVTRVQTDREVNIGYGKKIYEIIDGAGGLEQTLNMLLKLLMF